MDDEQYIFQPFVFRTLHTDYDSLKLPCTVQEPAVCTDGYLIACEGPNPFKNEVTLWKSYFDLHRSKKINCRGVPQDLTQITVLLTGSVIFMYGVPRSDVSHYRLYYGNLDDESKEGGMIIKEIEINGDVPAPKNGYAQSVLIEGSNMFVIGGSDIELDVFRLDLTTRHWFQLYSATEDELPDIRDSHQMVFYNNRLYTFHSRGSTAAVPYMFSQIHVFNLETNLWEILQAKKDDSMLTAGYPADRVGHNCIQCPENKNWVYICGGFNGITALFDFWRFDINTIQWEYLPKCIMPVAIFNCHAMAISDSGHLCCYGGSSNDNYYNTSNDIISTWIVIPPLKVISWEAMVFYFKDQMAASSDEELKKLGLPIKCYERMIEAKADD